MLDKVLRSVLALSLIGAQCFAPAFASPQAIMQLGFSKHFGGAEHSAPFSLSFGTSAVIPEDLQLLSAQKYLPATGLHYAPGQGLSPLLLGVPWQAAEPALLNTPGQEDSFWRRHGVWIGAASAILTGLVVSGVLEEAFEDAADDFGEGDNNNADDNGDEGDCNLIGGDINVTDPTSSNPIIYGPNCSTGF